MPARVVVLRTSARVAPGLLSWPAWQELRAGAVRTDDPAHPQLPALAEAAIEVTVVDEVPPDEQAGRLAELAAADGRTAVWLGSPSADAPLVAALEALAGPELAVEVLAGPADLPGARLLDVVATMDRLRSPGGCPWDARQTHESLAPYLLEEAYEAYQAIEDGDPVALREELGDVLLQVAFHARVAAEGADGPPWTVDDVAAGLVEKLVRRHPHVFGDREVSGADEVTANWEVIKAAEKGRTSVTDGVALAQPALTLAATLQRRASRIGVPAELLAGAAAAADTPARSVAAAAAAAESDPGPDTVGELLWAAVLLARSLDLDPEVALRGRARAFRDALATAERAARAAGLDPHALDQAGWDRHWPGP